MNWNLNISIPEVLLGVFGAALITAGVVAYRGSTRTWTRAFAAAMVAVGVTVWALILWVTPVSLTSSSARGVLSSVSSAAPTAIPTVAVPVGWQLYRSEDFEFSYPVACPVTQSNGSLAVGGRIELVMADAKGLALQDYVSQFVDERTRTSGWKLESRQAALVAGDKAVRIEYRFGGTNRYGTATFVEQMGRVYIWGLTAGGFTCEEPEAFDGIVSSFRFTPSGSSTPTGR